MLDAEPAGLPAAAPAAAAVPAGLPAGLPAAAAEPAGLPAPAQPDAEFGPPAGPPATEPDGPPAAARVDQPIVPPNSCTSWVGGTEVSPGLSQIHGVPKRLKTQIKGTCMPKR